MAIETTQPQVSPHTPLLPHSPSADVIVRSGCPVERLQVDAELHLLAPGGALFARDLCGWQFWQQFHWRDRPMAGRCLAHLVATRRIGLVFAQSAPSYPLRYRLKAQAA